MPKQDKKALVVRHNKLIESRHRLSLPERRFMLWIASKIQKEDEDFKVYTVKVSEFVAFAGLKEDDKYYTRLIKMADSLTSKNIGIRDDVNGRYDSYSWFQQVSYIWDEGKIEARLNPILKPYLLDLQKNYTPVYLEYVLLLRRESSHRIYELLKQYQKIGSREMDISFLREILEIEEKQYPRYADFRRRILEPSQKEIGEKTDISFAFEPIKTGRSITGLRFVITENTPIITLENNPEETDPELNTLFKKLMKHGIHEKTARELVGEYDTDRVLWHIDEYQERLKSDQKPESVGWLIKGIEEDYRTQQSLFEKEEAEKREQKKQAKVQQKALEKEIDLLKAECDKYNRKKKQEILDVMTEGEYTAMYDAILQKYGNAMGLQEKIEKEGTSNAVIFGLSLEYINTKYPDVVTSYLEFANETDVKKVVLEELQRTG